jgi:hypothetical protein
VKREEGRRKKEKGTEERREEKRENGPGQTLFSARHAHVSFSIFPACGAQHGV